MHCFSFISMGLSRLYLLAMFSAVWMETLSDAGIAQESQPFVSRRIEAVCFDSERRQAIVGSEGSLAVQNLPASGGLESTEPVDRGSAGIRFFGGKQVSKARSIDLPFSHVSKVELSPDRKILLVAGGDPGQRGCTQLLDWPLGSPIRMIDKHRDSKPIDDMITDVSWFASGKQWIECHWSGSVVVRRLDGSIAGGFSGHTGPATSGIAWGDELCISCGIDKTIKVWRLSDGVLVRSLDNHTGAVTGLLRWKNADEKTFLISMGTDKTVRLWDPSIGRLIRFVKLPDVPRAMRISDQGELIVLQETSTAIRVSLPALRIEETVSLGERPDGSLIQSGPGQWYYW